MRSTKSAVKWQRHPQWMNSPGCLTALVLVGVTVAIAQAQSTDPVASSKRSTEAIQWSDIEDGFKTMSRPTVSDATSERETLKSLAEKRAVKQATREEIVDVFLMTSSGSVLAAFTAERAWVSLKSLGFLAAKDLKGHWHFASGCFVFVVPTSGKPKGIDGDVKDGLCTVRVCSSDGKENVFSGTVGSGDVTIGFAGYCTVKTGDGKKYESIGGIVYVSPARVPPNTHDYSEE